ncbi:MAG: hypothetical protein FJY10_03150 [Bacteroidetes bacterium]|nr:hypothetical protein [Bacteroidota bacterium]
MKKILLSLLLQCLFWILFFALNRVVFLIYHADLVGAEQAGFSDAIKSFWYALHLDAATVTYFIAFPFLILVVQSFYSPRWLNYLNLGYALIMMLSYALISMAEIGLYPEWKTKLSYKALKYLQNPDEVYNSADTTTFFILLALAAVITLVSFYVYRKWFYKFITGQGCHLIFSFCFLLLTPGLLFLVMRGGWQQIPINQSASYYSKHNILNLAAVNNAFNLYISIHENLKNFDRNPYVFYPQEEALRRVDAIRHVSVDTTIGILQTQRPNIVLIIMEGWSADCIESLDGDAGITPVFRNLEAQGVLFTRIYASGARSEQGMACIFGGFPAHPISSITIQPDKFAKLPSLVKALQQEGYYSAYYFGGQLIYGNMKGYVISAGFDKVMEIYDFPGKLPKGKLGIHDEYTFDYLCKDMDQFRQPFFTALFTLSSHSPYDYDFERPITWGDQEREYLNSVFYADHCLGEFIRCASRKSWFDNTLFIVVSDHGHSSHRNWSPYSMEYQRIPMMFFGEVIRDEARGMKIDKLGGHHDIPATLLQQLNLEAGEFTWSKDLMNPFSPGYAWYALDDGLGWIRPFGNFVYERSIDYYHFLKADPSLQDSLIKEGKSYLQVLFATYQEY